MLVLIGALFAMVSCRKDPLPPSPEDPEVFAACVIPGTPATLDIATFNVEGFPKNGHISVVALASLLKAMDVDVIALQEVASEADFNRMITLMPGWTGEFYDIDNDQWNLAYIFKKSETEVVANSDQLLFTGDARAFPRPPFEIFIRHKPLNLEVCLINLHLKCCGGEDNEKRRREASVKLKDYLDQSRYDDHVVVLGDFNDEITGTSSSENPFLNFIQDPEDYTFADMEIARGSALWWSYPDYPSHIDHILLTGGLVPLVDTTLVIKASPCYPEYNTNLSDHRPVVVRLRR
jgi:endonuclease/exonuclease/phosphatase family metal-dependent hydrolase